LRLASPRQRLRSLVRERPLAHLPSAALAGFLSSSRCACAGRRDGDAEAKSGRVSLILVTAFAIVTLPIEQGASASCCLCCTAYGRRRPAIELERIPGTSIWWPRDKDVQGEFVPAVRVIACRRPVVSTPTIFAAPSGFA
jgi:hypothetical protein